MMIIGVQTLLVEGIPAQRNQSYQSHAEIFSIYWENPPVSQISHFDNSPDTTSQHTTPSATPRL